MRILKTLLLTVTSLLCFHIPAYAALELVLTQGIDSALPIAVVPFEGQDNDGLSADNLAAVVNADLQQSGRFKTLANNVMPAKPHDAATVENSLWRKTGVESVVVGKVQNVAGNRYKIAFSLVDLFKSGEGNHTLLTREFTVPASQLRKAGHHIADLVYEQLTGNRGVFSTRIAYVVIQRQAGENSRYQLIVADADGYNPKPILSSFEPIMSPSWSHDGSRIAYVSFEGKRAQIMISDVATGTRRKVTEFAGINGAPAWSPDDTKLAIVLSKNGSPKIYTIGINGSDLQQITQGSSIDTEPSWDPTGHSIIFTSDRGGSPQLYQVSPNGGKVHRVTFEGRYNARGRFTPDGKRIVMIHGEHGYNIATQDLNRGNIQILTKSGRNDSPSVAPNGVMVLYGTEFGELGVVSIDGKVQLRLPATEGKVQDPAWSPFLN